MTSMLRAARILVAALACLCAVGPALAQDFPNRPITLICPWTPGGSTDTHLRKFAQVAAKYLGQPIIVENKPGAGGMLGPAAMANTAKPDGYTLSQLPMGAFRIPHMQKVDWDPIRDFTYIIGVTGYTFGIVVKSDSPFKTFNDFLAEAKAKPNMVSFASTGIGTSPHLLVEEVAEKAGVKLVHVPYKGSSEALQALMGGHVMAASDATGWARHVEQGAFRLLVTFGDQRAKWGAPTAKELGLNIVSYSPYGIVGPKGMDPKIVKILHDAFKKTMDDPEHLAVLQQFDQIYWYKSSDDYARWAADTFKSEKTTIERLGLQLK